MEQKCKLLFIIINLPMTIYPNITMKQVLDHQRAKQEKQVKRPHKKIYNINLT